MFSADYMFIRIFAKNGVMIRKLWDWYFPVSWYVFSVRELFCEIISVRELFSTGKKVRELFSQTNYFSGPVIYVSFYLLYVVSLIGSWRSWYRSVFDDTGAVWKLKMRAFKRHVSLQKRTSIETVIVQSRPDTDKNHIKIRLTRNPQIWSLIVTSV